MSDKMKAVINGWSYQILCAAQVAQARKVGGSVDVNDVRGVLLDGRIKVPADFVKGALDRLVSVGLVEASKGLYETNADGDKLARSLIALPALGDGLWTEEFRDTYRDLVVLAALGTLDKGTWAGSETLAKMTGMSVTTIRATAQAMRRAGTVEYRRSPGESGRPTDEFSLPVPPAPDPAQDDDDFDGVGQEPPAAPKLPTDKALPSDVADALADEVQTSAGTLLNPSPTGDGNGCPTRGTPDCLGPCEGCPDETFANDTDRAAMKDGTLQPEQPVPSAPKAFLRGTPVQTVDQELAEMPAAKKVGVCISVYEDTFKQVEALAFLANLPVEDVIESLLMNAVQAARGGVRQVVDGTAS